MSSVYIAKRTLKPDEKTGRPRYSYAVRWEEGRNSDTVHLGSYPTRTVAKERQKEVREQLARGETPTLKPLVEASSRTLGELAQKWLASRTDVADATMRSFEFSVRLIEEAWGTHDPASLTVDQIRAWISDHNYQTGTLRLILSHLSQILEEGDIEPNPVLSKKLKLPRQASKKPRLPKRADLAAMYEKLPEKNRDPVAMMEHGGLRISEVIALVWADVHPGRGYLIVRAAKTNAGERVVKQINGLPVLPTRPDGVPETARVFQNVTEQSVASAIRKACEDASVPHVFPHLLRKLHISRLMHNQKLDPATIAARVGHTNANITFKTYTLLIPEEDH